MKPTTPTRRRALVTAETKKKPSTALVALAAQVLAANTAMNDATTTHRKLRAKLLGEMRDAGFTHFDATTLIDGKQVSFDAVIAAPERAVIDVAKLRKLVSEDVFMQCVSASKQAVEQHAGGAVATQCSVLGRGEENVTVKPKK